ncbi:hypothetical protein [Candidatus Nitrospira salsa]
MSWSIPDIQGSYLNGAFTEVLREQMKTWMVDGIICVSPGM